MEIVRNVEVVTYRDFVELRVICLRRMSISTNGKKQETEMRVKHNNVEI
jgi:hypothetical protein